MAAGDVLQTWKEISEYMGRTERTLQHWEQQFGFPVHRPSGKSRSSVMALPQEIEEWTRGKPSLPQIRRTARLSRAQLLTNPGSEHSSGKQRSRLRFADGHTRRDRHIVRGKLLADVTVERLQLSGVLREKQKNLQEHIMHLLREQRSLCEKLRERIDSKDSPQK